MSPSVGYVSCKSGVYQVVGADLEGITLSAVTRGCFNNTERLGGDTVATLDRGDHTMCVDSGGGKESKENRSDLRLGEHDVKIEEMESEPVTKALALKKE
jgi:hypothetical protein